MTIKKVSGGEIVVSKKGKRLTKPKSHEGALKDLQRIEYFKHHSKSIVSKEDVDAGRYEVIGIVDKDMTERKMALKNAVEKDKILEKKGQYSKEYAQVQAESQLPGNYEKNDNYRDHPGSYSSKSIRIAGMNICFLCKDHSLDNDTRPADKRQMFMWVDKKKRREVEKLNPHMPKMTFNKEGKATGTEKSEMPETIIYPKKKPNTNSPIGTLVEEIKETMAKRDKRAEEDKSEKSIVFKSGEKKLIVGPWRAKNLDREIDEQMAMPRKVAEDARKEKLKIKGTHKSVIGPFRQPEGKTDSGYGAELRRRAQERKEKEAAANKLESNNKKAEKADRPNPITGGIGDKLSPKDVDPEELQTGIEIEQEHNKNDESKSPEQKTAEAQDIALDHLAEDDKYYTNLVEMERRSKSEAKNETQKRKIIAETENAEKSIIKEKKLKQKAEGAENMVKIREKVGGSPWEMKIARGQLKAYTAKLRAERKKNEGLNQ